MSAGAVYETSNAGYMAVIREIQKVGIRIIESYELNFNRYTITRTEDRTYLIAYKRDFFRSFGKIFESEGEYGAGELRDK